jgi:hypothetical protein
LPSFAVVCASKFTKDINTSTRKKFFILCPVMIVGKYAQAKFKKDFIFSNRGGEKDNFPLK